MKWSKLKRTTEELLAEPLKNRVAYNLTRYGPGVSHVMSRGWITFDKQEIINCSSVKFDIECCNLIGDDHTDDKQVLEQLHKQGIFTREDFVGALEKYVTLKISDALKSVNPIIRALAMFDEI